MKKVLCCLMIVTMTLSLLSGCARELTVDEMLEKIDEETILERAEEILAQREEKIQTTEPVKTPKPEVQASQAPEQTPVILSAPIELLGEELNPFFDVEFPAGCTIYAAYFETGDKEKGTGPNYVLFATAEGEPADTVRFVCELCGFNDEDSINEQINQINNEHFCSIDGTQNGNGMNIMCLVKETEERYEQENVKEVDGCRIELTAFIDDNLTESYKKVVDENFNMNMFVGLEDAFSSGINNEYGCTVNTYNPAFTTVHRIYEVSDAAGLRDRILSDMDYNWYDEDSQRMEVSYGRISAEISFEDSNVMIIQKLHDSLTSSANYVKPEVSLETLGFFNAGQGTAYVFEDREHGFSIAVDKPEWGQEEGSWDMEFLCEMENGSLVAVWYYVGEQKLVIQADKGGASAKYEYYIETEEFGGEYPDAEMAQNIFKKVFDVPDSLEYPYEAAVERQKSIVYDAFGLTLDDIYALPER